MRAPVAGRAAVPRRGAGRAAPPAASRGCAAAASCRGRTSRRSRATSWRRPSGSSACPTSGAGAAPAASTARALVQLALLAVGRAAPRDSDMQAALLGAALPADAALRRGDLVFWKGHVGIMRDADDAAARQRPPHGGGVRAAAGRGADRGRRGRRLSPGAGGSEARRSGGEEPRPRPAAQRGGRLRAHGGAVGGGAVRLVVRARSVPSGRRISPRKRSRPPASSASPAIGVWHEPSRPARKARSAASRRPVSGCGSRASSAATARRRRRAARPRSPPARRRAASPRARSAARRRRRCPAAAARPWRGRSPPPRLRASLRSRVSTLPRNSTTARSGRRWRSCARRRRLEVPTTPPAGSAASERGRARRRRRAGPRAAAGSDGEARGLQRRHVLHRVDGDVDPPAGQRLLDLAGEEALAAERPTAAGPAPGRRWCG